jgi:hypothetical protein
VRAALDAAHHFTSSACAFKWGAIFFTAVAQAVARDLRGFVFVV